jgi:hypothetical protein
MQRRPLVCALLLLVTTSARAAPCPLVHLDFLAVVVNQSSQAAQAADGSVIVPEVLRKWMGKDCIVAS